MTNELTSTAVLGYVTLFAPLVATVLITLFTLRSKPISGALALLGIGTSLVCTLLLALDTLGAGEVRRFQHEFVWLSAGGITLKFGVLVDSLSVLMSFVVTGVGSCIFVYSLGYMRGEQGWSRFFAKLSLFAFSMLGIVFSTNFAETFIFWELVGVSSYALIGYYIERPSAVDAGKKAFLTNRIGDFGMTWGIILLFFTLAQHGLPTTLTFTELAPLFHEGAKNGLDPYEGTLALAAFLIFTGAMAKSAQVPLHVWLPDAMEGPTPVSALMHAATMVAAGVYLTARIYFLFFAYHTPLVAIAWIGGATALLAACMAFVQYDVKKVLAYSTLSQLGYMTMSLGLFGPAAAMFHLTTHAFFKALLFLGAGSVIHGCHHEQDMRQMGGLRRHMPVTAWTFVAGSLALAGIFPLAGFWSKDAILGAALQHNPVLYGLGLVVAFMTACYMGRAYFMTFEGQYRGHAHPHESPKVMTLPLVVLAVGSVLGGALSLPLGFPGVGHAGLVEEWLMGRGGPVGFPGAPEEVFHWSVAIGGTVAALAGMFVAWKFHGAKTWSIDAFVKAIGPVHRVVDNKFYFDDFYLWLVGAVQQRFADVCAFFEKNVLVQGIVNGVAGLTRWLGYQVRLLLDGHLHRYVTLALVGIVAVLAYLGGRR